MSHINQMDQIANESASDFPSEPAPPIQSRFLFVDVAALRAKQLRRGARPRLGEDVPLWPHKAERVAMEEVKRGLVSYEVREPRPAPEALEA
jgi:DNA-directed RNA polymerase subunit K/omega